MLYYHNTEMLTDIVIQAAQWFWGEPDNLLLSLAVFTTMEFFTAILIMPSESAYSPRLFFQEIWKRTAILFIVSIANRLDICLQITDPGIRTNIIWFCIAQEITAISEHWSHTLR